VSLRLGLLVAAAVVLGVASEAAAFAWDEPGRWIPDFVVGLVFIGCGMVAWLRLGERGTGALVAATGVAWFAGGFSSVLLYLHRGPLVHLLLAYPGARPRTRLDSVAVGAGYAAALAWPVWRSDVATIVLAVALLAVAARGYAGAAGRVRRARLVALQATTALAVVLAGGAAARLALPAGDAADPTLIAYEIVLCLIALFLVAELREDRAPAVADLVVELGETRSGTLRDALSRALGDPGLEVGYWRPDTGDFRDLEGGRIELPRDGADRSATVLKRDGRPVAVLVHDPAVVTDPALKEALSAAAGLAASNAALQAEVREQLGDLAASSRRLLAVAGEERRRLEERLRAGPEHNLGRLADALERSVPGARGETHEHIAQVSEQLALVLAELRELGRGLHPGELSDQGLRAALATLAARNPVRVELTVADVRLPPEIETACYFVCAEALANVTKYASASSVSIRVALEDDRLRARITDDGVGGADPSRGTGLRGLRDRVEALGGTLTVESSPGHGTRLSVEIPVAP
jgi:signal transduction histidine kinase